jgi:hypothetical protein
VGHWALGKTFFSTRVSMAMFYAREKSRARPEILRIRRDCLDDALPDHKCEEGSV